MRCLRVHGIGILMVEASIVIWGGICINCNSQSFGFGAIALGMWHCILAQQLQYCSRDTSDVTIERIATLYINTDKGYLFITTAIIIWRKRDHKWHIAVTCLGCGTQQEFPDYCKDYFRRLSGFLAFTQSRKSVAREILICNCPFSFLLWLLWKFILHSILLTILQFLMII